ncbi:hypothetical protein PVAND_004319 [Polypedilum vanderplanki]|uniref:SMP-30/Gluconolactonase/LRE-like region domain-containing protein n=1 Tax=Polypedilum vanderplanki TaxID=319348 RepID=A0A9J6BXC5_POLVA|nr:hypothetical protein PVAND_004319 [Polypedilum vanderplanki]
MSQNLKIEEITNKVQRCELLEGPHWDVELQSLYFVDILGPAIFRYCYKNREIYRATIKDKEETRIGFIIPVDNNTTEFVVGLGKELTIIKWDGKSVQATVVEVLAKVDSNIDEYRINDGKCDPHGLVYFGTMGDPIDKTLSEKLPGSLYRYDVLSKSLVNMRDRIGIGNGLTWNEKLGKFYYIDSVTRNIKVFDYDSLSGNFSNEEVLIDFSKTHTESFLPDGMTIDENGLIYVATWNGSKIIIIDSTTKTIKNEIIFPTAKITSAAFGGPNLDILYVTTAIGHNNAKVGSAGGLFKVTGPNIKGPEMIKFKMY